MEKQTINEMPWIWTDNVKEKVQEKKRCLYKKLDTREGERDLYKLSRARYRQTQDVVTSLM
ncbi:hypothetical protein ANCDUO_08719 [Ancylostoma duodenale]|uniref:Uncharacterized protein n=1 Tax=Ancylostoma duodenale TaxID=51022 RepID=A0A0C2GIJ4_9BILA|nr:hypothetical protein ANCDUO_08719 [Ancylostoma duodenale]